MGSLIILLACYLIIAVIVFISFYKSFRWLTSIILIKFVDKENIANNPKLYYCNGWYIFFTAFCILLGICYLL